MADFGWSYPPGCNSVPGDHELSMCPYCGAPVKDEGTLNDSLIAAADDLLAAAKQVLYGGSSSKSQAQAFIALEMAVAKAEGGAEPNNVKFITP